MELILSIQEKIRIATMRFLLNKKWVRNVGMTLLGLLVLLGIMRACYFSSGHPKSQYYWIARNISWNDFHFTGKEPNVQAFAEELVVAASKEANLRVQFVTANPNTLLEDLRAEKYDAVFTFMVPNSLNKETYYFSDPLYRLGSVLVVRGDSEVQNLEEMEGKIIGISREDSSIYEVNYYPSLIILTYDNINAALNDLTNNKIDGVIMDTWNAHAYIHGFYAKLKVATLPFTSQGLRLATLAHIDSDLEDFIKSFNDGLERLKVNGQYQKLINKWDLYEVQ